MSALIQFTALFEGKDLRPVLMKAGYTEPMANWAHGVNSKYAGFVARAAFDFPRNWVDEDDQARDARLHRGTTKLARIKEVITKLFQEQVKPKLSFKPADLTLEAGEELVQQLQWMRDWWTQPEVSINPQALTWNEVMSQAHLWYGAQQAGAGAELQVKKGQEVVHQFDDGSYWLNLNTSNCREEGDAMGHCGRSDGDGVLYSYRDVKGAPHLTADIFEDKELCGQVYAKGNSNPPAKYHRIILTLVGKLGLQKIRASNHGEKSFSWSDLSEEDLEWFEDEFGYELTKSGVTDAAINEAEEIVSNYEWSGPVHEYHDWSMDREIFSVDGELYLDISGYKTTDAWDKGDWRHRTAMLNSIDGYISFVTDGDDILRAEELESHWFDPEEGSGAVDSEPYDDIVEWAEAACRSIDMINDDWSYAKLLTLLSLAEILAEDDPFVSLAIAHEDEFDQEYEITTTLPPIHDFKIDSVREPEGNWRDILEVTIRPLGMDALDQDSETLKKLLVDGSAPEYVQRELPFPDRPPEKEIKDFSHLKIQNTKDTIRFTVDHDDAEALMRVLRALVHEDSQLITALNLLGRGGESEQYYRKMYGLAERFLRLFA